VISVLRSVLWVGLLAVAVSCWAQVKATPTSRRQEALTLEQQGRTAEAETVWRAISSAEPSNPEAYAHLGLLEARQEHYKEAVTLYRKALKLGPAVPGLRLNLGLALFKGGDLEGAIQEFEPLEKGHPESQQLNVLLGMAHYGRAQYAKAIPYLRKAALHDQHNLPLLLALAQSCLWTNQGQCVLDVYREILTINPDSAEADVLAGEALDEMKDNAGSTRMFRAAVKADPRLPNAHFGLGYLLWTQKQYKEAASEFEAELAIDPNHLQSTLYLADADIQMNQMDDARPLLERVIKLDPAQPLAHLDLGIVCSEAGENQQALHELQIAQKMIPNDVNVHWRLGRLYRTLGRKDEAKIEFDKASSLNKQEDEDLYKKIASGAAHHPQQQTEPAAVPQP
jgi:tetratricopeptide (TPR) repeat protein